jgi:hypothetical protein
MLAAFFIFPGQGTGAAQAAPDAITLTGPTPNTVIAETDDYATQVLGDPWDMNNLNDLDQPYHLTNFGVSSGVWTGTTTGAAHTASVHLQYQNYANSYSYLGEDDGVNNPVQPSRFTRLLFRMYSAAQSHSVMYYFNHYNYAPAGNSGIIPVQAGWNIYSVDLRQAGSGNWLQAGPYAGLRLDPPSPAAGNVVQYDWVRLTPDTGETVRITWTGATGNNVNLYLSYSPVATEDNEYLIATTSATAGAYSWNTTGVAPGSYYIHAESGGGWSSIGPLIVNETPLVRIDAPGPLSGEEYAYAAEAAGWDGNFPGQFDTVRNINNLSFTPGAISGTPANNDPALYWLDQETAHPIDASKYHYFNVKFWLSPPAARPFSPYNAGTRLLWGSGPSLSTTEIILAPYNRWIPAAYDLRQIQLVSGGPSDWGGTKTVFRFDPLEQDDAYGEPAALPTGFMIQAAHLTSDPVAGHMGGAGSGLEGTFIRWTPLQGNGVVTLYRQAADQEDKEEGGTIIAENIPMAQGQYLWDTAPVPPGTYNIYADVQDGRNLSRAYALAPIVVTRQQPATLFNDVPGNLWAVDFINRLARLGIIGGSQQPDTTVLFKPNNTATRAQLSKMVVLAAGWTLLNPPTPTFNDVPVGSTFYQYVETAADNGVISGYDCGGPGEPCPGRYFRPNNNVTRGQVTKMIMLAFGFPEDTSGGPHFSDVPVGSTFYANIETLYNLGIIGGYSDGTFRPSNLVTRAQVSKMISLGLDVP